VQYRIHKPGAPLVGHVDFLWALSDAPDHARERILPNGTIELVVNLAEDRFAIASARAAGSLQLPGAMVSGCYRAPFEIDTRVHASIVGVHFAPGGAAGLLGAAPGELADTHVGLGELWAGAAVELRERLCAAASVDERFRILERALRDRLARAREPRAAVRAALVALERPGSEVGRVTQDLQLSRRRFIEIFTQDVGMTPKRYARVRRFQRALSRATAQRAPAWAELATACGYADQSHLCREWAELAGVSPSELVMLRNARVKEGHLAVPDEGVKSIQDVVASAP